MLSACPETGMEFCRVFRMEHDGPFDLNREELLGGRWYSPAELDRWIASGGKGLTEAFQLIWGNARELFLV